MHKVHSPSTWSTGDAKVKESIKTELEKIHIYIFYIPRNCKSWCSPNNHKQLVKQVIEKHLSDSAKVSRLGSKFCCRSVTQSCPPLCDHMDCSMQASLSFIISRTLREMMSLHHLYMRILSLPENMYMIVLCKVQIETGRGLNWVSDAIQPSCLCCPLLLLPSIFPSIRAFQ